MIFSRLDHINFLEQELRAQTEAFKQKLETSALFLLQEREELFVAQFLKFQDGEMILKFSNKRGIPRLGEYLYCITIPKALRDYNNWNNKTYGDLIKTKDNYTDIVCIWQSPSIEKDFIIAGFRGIELDFATHIQNAEGMILILGPKKPPFEYITNLQKIVNNQTNDVVKNILDQDFHFSDWTPRMLDGNSNIVKFIRTQLQLQNSIIIQGPPGTGKTHLIAEFIRKLTNENKSVLVTALTNRALMEIVEKPALINHLKEQRVFKTKLSVDEARFHTDLKQTKEISPQPGKVILSTFYITSGLASQIKNEPPFDYVIVDEASQALLAMFAGATLLGKKNIWIGDTKQLPPVVSLSEDKIKGIGFAILAWLFTAVIYDGLFLVSLVIFDEYPLEYFALGASVFNPIDLSRILIILKLDISALLGYTGAVLQNFFGTSVGMLITSIMLMLWMFIPLKMIVSKSKKKDF